MTQPTLSQLLTAFRSGDHVDAKRLADAITAMTQGQDNLLKRLLADIGLLSQRLSRLERIVSGNDTPEDLVEPRPQAKLGDEFPTVEPTPAEQDAIVERLFARAVGVREVKPLRSPVRVDSLKVGDNCWVECETVDLRPDRDGYVVVNAEQADEIWRLKQDALVLPVEPSAKVEAVDPGYRTVPGADVKPGSWLLMNGHDCPVFLALGVIRYLDVSSVASNGAPLTPSVKHDRTYQVRGQDILVADLGPVSQPIRLKVGERYERRDGVIVDCVAHNPELAGQDGEFECEVLKGGRAGYYANGRFIDQEHPVDIVRHVGPSPVAPARPEWATPLSVNWLRRVAEDPAYLNRGPWSQFKARDEVFRAASERAREMLAELGVKP